MDERHFDNLARWLSSNWNRRAATLALGGAAAAPWLEIGTTPAKGKRTRKKKSTLCLDGQTVLASGKKKKKLLKQGATSGECPSSPPPVSPPPTACTPQCAARSCGGSNGCGGTCACTGDAICHQGVCQECTVVCTGNEVACGAALSLALLDGGAIYACPGRYAGNFTIGVDNTTLIGAGNGTNPRNSTILDARDSGRVLSIEDTVGHVSLAGLRLTGGNLEETDLGGAIKAISADLRIDACAVEENIALYGGGMYLGGRLRLNNSTVSNNHAAVGGGIYLDGCDPSFITDSVFAENTASMGVGGGIINGYTMLTVVGTEIRKNDASAAGGGISNYFGDLILDAACQITLNTAGVTGGGGIFNENGTVQLNGAVVIDNTPDDCANC